MELNPFENIEGKELDGNTWEYSYRELLQSITGDVYWQLEAGFTDYQGDFFFLGFDADTSFYFVVGGYGSCSGCDALQSCYNLDDLKELRDDIKRDIRKFGSKDEFESWFNNEGQLQYYSSDDIKDFIEEAEKQFQLKLKWRDGEW